MKRIFVPLATGPWSRFAYGSKTVEVRSASSPVAAQVRKAQAGAPVLLRLGYSGDRNLHGALGRVWEVSCWAELPDEARTAADLGAPGDPGRWFDVDVPLLAFEVIFQTPVAEQWPGGQT